MNAIILAAGMGTRLRPLTNDRPKCLVEVNGIPMVERQIQFLKEKGIDDITLISGYKAEALDFLKEKYGVDIVFNDRYDSCNNINSLYIVRDRFHDTYVIEGDVYMDKNILVHVNIAFHHVCVMESISNDIQGIDVITRIVSVVENYIHSILFFQEIQGISLIS